MYILNEVRVAVYVGIVSVLAWALWPRSADLAEDADPDGDIIQTLEGVEAFLVIIGVCAVAIVVLESLYRGQLKWSEHRSRKARE